MKKSFDREVVKFYLRVALAFFVFGSLFTWHSYPAGLLAVVKNSLWGLSYVTVLNFVLFEYSVPFVLRKRKNLVYPIVSGLLLLFLHSMLYPYGSYGWRQLGIGLGIYTPLKIFTSYSQALQSQMGYSVASVFFFGIARHIYQYNQLKQAQQKLRIEKQQAELNYLRSQTNPHFLFNTLNNIYSLARDRSALAPESILRLSKILRFMLYETSGDYISIEQELKIITDYIELEKLRYDEALQIDFVTDIEDRRQALPPLLLMPLVENAFKHGVSETRVRPFVRLHLVVKNRQLLFEVKNSSEAADEKTVKENIGLSNLRRQLELLYTDHDLWVEQAASVFTARLKINLASHA
jgi:sensor histidine kinase YesM